jgi:hypothetical protein
MLGPAYEEALRQSDPAHARATRVEELQAGLARAPELVISEATTAQDAQRCHRSFGTLDRYEIGGGRFRGQSPWERHPFDDELLVAVAGEAEITLLRESGPDQHVLRAGQLFVVPRGLWHRQLARDGATIWGATATAHDEISFAEDPRAKS